jgi:hypothetical protein
MTEITFRFGRIEDVLRRQRIVLSAEVGAVFYLHILLVPSFPRRQESSKNTSPQMDKTMVLARFAGIISQLDSRLRGNDEFCG